MIRLFSWAWRRHLDGRTVVRVTGPMIPKITKHGKVTIYCDGREPKVRVEDFEIEDGANLSESMAVALAWAYKVLRSISSKRQ
jgi:hypothetical protein